MSFELNKIAGAILGTLLLVMGLGFLAEAIYAPIEDNRAGYALPEPEEGGESAPVEEVAATPLPVLLASASAQDGASAARKCASCHNFGEGEGNKTGPGLYDVVGRPIASHEGFSYSDALIAYGDEHGAWTYETLAAFIHDPRGDVPGTKMTFAGIRGEEELANVLAYLQSLSGDPVPFPAVEAAPEAAPAADAAPAAEADAAAEEAPATEETPAAEEPAAADQNADAAMAEAPAADSEQPMAEEAPATDAAAADETPATDEPAADEPMSEEPAMEAESATADESAMAADASAVSEPTELEMAIANASLEDGASVMRNCRACHDWVEGGRNKVGPLLYDVVGRQIASEEGYSYSDAMTAFGEENGVWTYELLNTFITDPRGTVTGTKMTFAGVKDADDRAAAIALLRTQSPDPVPLPGAE